MSKDSAKNIGQYAPIGVSVLVFAGSLLFGNKLLALISAGTIGLTSLYDAVFGWAAIQTGFLFSVYGFIAGKRKGFIGAIRGTPAMKNFNSYLWRAMAAGFLLTFWSMPMLVLEITPDDYSVKYVITALWFSVFIWGFLSFLRVAYIFGIIVRVPDRPHRPA